MSDDAATRKAKEIVDEWFPTERGKGPLIKSIASALKEATAGQAQREPTEWQQKAAQEIQSKRKDLCACAECETTIAAIIAQHAPDKD